MAEEAPSGQKWLNTRQMLDTVDLDSLREAGNDWTLLASILAQAEAGMDDPERALRDTNLVADSASPLWLRLGQARTSMRAMLQDLRANDPKGALDGLIAHVEDAKRWMDEQAGGGFLGAGGFPTMNTGDGDRDLYYDVLRRQFDDRAGDVQHESVEARVPPRPDVGDVRDAGRCDVTAPALGL